MELQAGFAEPQYITRLLHSARDGNHQALNHLYDEIFPVLRRIAASQSGVRADMTLSPTVVVNELFLKIADSSAMNSQDRRHFFATCARAMRFIIADFARRSLAKKRGSELEVIPFVTSLASQPDQAQELLEIHDALDQLETVEPRLREVVELKFFGGLDYQEIADLHGLSERTIKRDWVRARALLLSLSQPQLPAF